MSGDSRHRSLEYKRLSAPVLHNEAVEQVVEEAAGVTWQAPDVDLGSLSEGKECELETPETGWRFERRATLSYERNQTAASGEVPPRAAVLSPPTNAE